MSNCIHECGCECHRIGDNTGATHIRPCCGVCPICRRRIDVIFMRAHQSICHERGGDTPAGFFGRLELG